MPVTFEVSKLLAFRPFVLEVMFCPADPEKLSLVPQKGTAFVVCYQGTNWLVTNLHNTEEETVAPCGKLDFPIVSIQTPKGGIFDLRSGRKYVIPYDGETAVDLIAIECFEHELPPSISLTPLHPFEWGGKAKGFQAEFVIPGHEPQSLPVSRYFIGVGFPGNSALAANVEPQINKLVHNEHLPTPHHFVDSYMPPMGKGASGGPIFEILNENKVKLSSVHTYSYNAGIKQLGQRDVLVPTGGGIRIEVLIEAIDSLIA